MTITARLEDARLLIEHGRWEGALLSVLVAMAATAHLRFPQGTPSRAKPGAEMRDCERFELFVAEALAQMSPLPDMSFGFKGQVRPFGELLYKWLRCKLAHEADLPPEIGFEPDPKPVHLAISQRPGPPERIVFTHSVVILLADMVARAAENADVPKQLRQEILDLFRHGLGAV